MTCLKLVPVSIPGVAQVVKVVVDQMVPVRHVMSAVGRLNFLRIFMAADLNPKTWAAISEWNSRKRGCASKRERDY